MLFSDSSLLTRFECYFRASFSWWYYLNETERYAAAAAEEVLLLPASGGRLLYLVHFIYFSMYCKYSGWSMEPASSPRTRTWRQSNIHEYGDVLHFVCYREYCCTLWHNAETSISPAAVHRIQLCVHSVHLSGGSRHVYLQTWRVPQGSRAHCSCRIPPHWRRYVFLVLLNDDQQSLQANEDVVRW